MKNEITPEGALDILENANIAISLVQARAKIKRRSSSNNSLIAKRKNKSQPK